MRMRGCMLALLRECPHQVTSLELIENKTELLLKPCTIIILFKNKNLIIGILFRIQTSINNPKF